MALTKIDDRGLTTPIDLLDNEKIRFGTGNDLEIYHDGNNNLILGSPTVLIKNKANSESYIRCNENAEVSLYYDGSKKLETFSEGTSITGRATIAYTGKPGKPTLTLGADNSQGSASLTDSTSKACRVGVYHYTNAEEPANILYAVGSDTTNQVNYGGGTSYMNAATHHKFFTAANTTTTSGTERVRIDGDGKVSIGTDTPHCTNKGVHIKTNDSGVTSADTNRDDVFIEGSDHTGITIATPNDKVGGIGFDDPDGAGRGRIQYAHGSDMMYIYTSGSPRAEFTEHLKINDGNLIIGTSGHGIDFSATGDGSGTANQELLDDYEEGVWTPGLTFGNGNTGLSLGTATGRYTKIGREIIAGFVINLSAVGSSTGTCRITGLPYTAINDSGTRIHGEVTYYGNMSSLEGRPYLYNSYNTTTVVMYDNGSAASSSYVTSSNFANNSVLRGLIWYKAA